MPECLEYRTTANSSISPQERLHSAPPLYGVNHIWLAVANESTNYVASPDAVL
jgi:hypothetical protein